MNDDARDRSPEMVYRRLAEETHDLVAEITSDGTFKYVSPSHEAVLGYKPADLLGRSAFELWHGEDRETLGVDIERSRGALPRALCRVVRYRKADGRWAVVLVEPRRLGSAVDADVLLLGRCADRVQGEGDPPSAVTWARRMFSQAPVGMAIVDYAMNIRHVNPALCEMLGYEADELTRMRVLDITHPEDRVVGIEPARRVAAGELPSFEVEKRYLTRDGAVRWCRLCVSTLRSDSGLPTHNLAILLDLTERKEAENALRAAAARYRALLQAAPLMLFRVRADGTILDFEQGRELVPAQPPEAFLGRTVQEVLPEPVGAACQAAIARALETREIRSYEYEFTHDGRSQTHAATLCADTEDEVVIAVRDLTRTRRVEEDLRRSEHLASIGALAAGIAHEVNNPIGAALAAAQYGLACRQDSNAVSVMSEALQDIVRETVRCGRIVKNLLKLARSEPGERWSTDPNRLLRQATELSRDYASSLGVELVLEPSSGTRPCTVSPLEIETALMNVIRNAIEATSPGGQVLLRTESAARGVRFVIRDEGCGIQPADRDRVVEPFFTTRREAGGTGLGLSIAQAAVASHEGSLSIQSEAGRGTTVLIFVPYGAQPLAEHERD